MISDIPGDSTSSVQPEQKLTMGAFDRMQKNVLA